MRLRLMRRREVAAAARREMEAFYAAGRCGESPIEAMCLFWAFFTVRACRRAGLPAQLQAGTAYWPTGPVNDGEESGPNVFGYEWDPGDPLTRAFLMRGQLPEMHCWAAVAGEPPEIIDLTARFFHARAAACGLEIRCPPPPEFFWHEGPELPPGVVYLADMEATHIAYQFLHAAVREAPLVVALPAAGRLPS